MSSSSENLRILFVCAYVPALGMSGGASRMFHIIRGAAARHKVTVLCYCDADEELEHVPDLEAICEHVEVIQRGQSLDDWVRDPFHLIPRAISLEFGNARMRRRVSEEIGSGDYDVAQFEFLDVAYLLPKRVKIPTILTHIEVQSRVIAQRLTAKNNPVQKLALLTQWVRAAYYEASVSKRFTTNVFLTENEAASILQFAPDIQYTVNHLGVDCSHFDGLDRAPTPGALVYLGYFRHRPNVDAVLFFCRSVLPRVWSERPDVTLTIVGGGPTEELQQLTSDPRIRVTGWVQDYRPLVSQAEVFVAPVISGAGMRTKIIEAWAQGKAVVATPLAIEGCGGINGDNVLVAAKPEGFARNVLRVLGDSSLRDRLAQSGRQTARRAYDWDVILRQHESVYSTTIHRFWKAAPELVAASA